MANFGPLAAEIGSLVWGTPANFNWFRVLASLLQRQRSLEANQTLLDVWTSLRLLHYIYIFGGCCPWRNFATCKIHVASKPSVLLYWHAALLHGTPAAGSAKLWGMVQGMELRNFRRGRHPYSVGQPPRLASAQILVSSVALSIAGLSRGKSCGQFSFFSKEYRLLKRNPLNFEMMSWIQGPGNVWIPRIKLSPVVTPSIY